jgi:hypothetical protein
MIYLDTSVLVAMHTHETSTAAIQGWYAGLGDTPLYSALWCVTEFGSALSIKQRTGQMTAKQATQAWKQFEAQCDGDLRLVQVNGDAFRHAAELARDSDSGLRAGDALHLAVAAQLKLSSLFTLDTVMRTSAERLGMKSVTLT